MNTFQDTRRSRFHDSRFLQNLRDARAHSLDQNGASDRVFLGEWVCQKTFCDGFRLALIGEALDDKNGGRSDGFDGVDAELPGLFENVPAVWIADGLPTGNFYMK